MNSRHLEALFFEDSSSSSTMAAGLLGPEMSEELQKCNIDVMEIVIVDAGSFPDGLGSVLAVLIPLKETAVYLDSFTVPAKSPAFLRPFELGAGLNLAPNKPPRSDGEGNKGQQQDPPIRFPHPAHPLLQSEPE